MLKKNLYFLKKIEILFLRLPKVSETQITCYKQNVLYYDFRDYGAPY